MNRIARLHRSAIFSYAACVVSLLFTATAVRDFIMGRPFFLIALTVMALGTAAAGSLFLGVADKVERRTENTPVEELLGA